MTRIPQPRWIETPYEHHVYVVRKYADPACGGNRETPWTVLHMRGGEGPDEVIGRYKTEAGANRKADALNTRVMAHPIPRTL